jgi:hypothetical protein
LVLFKLWELNNMNLMRLRVKGSPHKPLARNLMNEFIIDRKRARELLISLRFSVVTYLPLLPLPHFHHGSHSANEAEHFYSALPT